MDFLFLITFFVPFFMFWVIFFIVFKQILKSFIGSNEIDQQAQNIFKKVKETTTIIDKNGNGDCVNDFDNTCEHVHLSNDIKEERYKIEDEVAIGKGPIDMETSSDPIRRE